MRPHSSRSAACGKPWIPASEQTPPHNPSRQCPRPFEYRPLARQRLLPPIAPAATLVGTAGILAAAN